MSMIQATFFDKLDHPFPFLTPLNLYYFSVFLEEGAKDNLSVKLGNHS